MEDWGCRRAPGGKLLASEGGGGGMVAELRLERLFSGGGISLTFLRSLERFCPKRGIFFLLCLLEYVFK